MYYYYSTLLREIPGTAIWFGAYEVTCEAIVNFASKSSTTTNRSNQTHVAGPIAQIVGGAVAGCLYWLLPYVSVHFLLARPFIKIPQICSLSIP